MVRVHLTFMIICLNLCSIAQKQYTIGLGTGISLLQSHDKAASMLVYSGHGLPLSFRGSIKSNNWWHQLDLSAISTSLTNAYTMKSIAGSQLNSWHWLRLKYALLYQLKQGQIFDTFIGVNFRSQFFYRAYNHLDGFSWEAINGLYINYILSHHRGKHHFSISVNLPLGAYLHRPQYTVDERFLEDLFKNQNILTYGYFSLPFQGFWQYDTTITYCYDLSENWGLALDIAFEQYQIKLPQKSQKISLQFLSHLTFTF